MTSTLQAEGNFLVPNGTFFAELFAFGLIVFVLAKWVVPPINKAMLERQESIRSRFDELDRAKLDAEAAAQEYKTELDKARHEAARMREVGREEGAQIVEEMRQQAHTEAERITSNAHRQIEVERNQAMHQLRSETGSVAATLAERILGESLADDERQRRTVARFIEELENDTSSSTSGSSS